MIYKKCRLYRLIGPAGAVSEKKLLYSDYFQKEDMENLPDFTRTAEPWAVWYGFPSNCRKNIPAAYSTAGAGRRGFSAIAKFMSAIFRDGNGRRIQTPFASMI